STRYGRWWLEPLAKTPAHGTTTTPWVAFSRLAPPPPAEMVGENARTVPWLAFLFHEEEEMLLG
ncbi:hypothetical protein Tco_1374316, partial [Tanacetum coccineum]